MGKRNPKDLLKRLTTQEKIGLLCMINNAERMMLEAAQAMRELDKMRDRAIELFQSGGDFNQILRLGDSIFSEPFLKMCDFICDHAETFIEYCERKYK